MTEVVKEIARCWSLMTKDDRMTYKLEAKRGKLLFVVADRFIEFQTRRDTRRSSDFWKVKALQSKNLRNAFLHT